MTIDTGQFPADMPSIDVLALILIADSFTESRSLEYFENEFRLTGNHALKMIHRLKRAGYIYARSYDEYNRPLFALSSDGHRLLDSMVATANF